MHRWPLVVAFALTACGGTTTARPVEPADAARDAMLDVRADGCGPRVGFGTATLIDDTLALTAAHVVAGADMVSVIDLDGVEHDARVVWFDPELDLAALRIPSDVGVPVPLQPGDVDGKGRAIIAVSRGAFDDRTVMTADVQIVRHVNVATTDIYLDRDIVRPGFEIGAEIEPGDSGTMVVTAGGAAGVVWSRSNSTEGRAWAVDVPDDFRRDDYRRSLDSDADSGRCLR